MLTPFKFQEQLNINFSMIIIMIVVHVFFVSKNMN